MASWTSTGATSVGGSPGQRREQQTSGADEDAVAKIRPSRGESHAAEPGGRPRSSAAGRHGWRSRAFTRRKYRQEGGSRVAASEHHAVIDGMLSPGSRQGSWATRSRESSDQRRTDKTALSHLENEPVASARRRSWDRPKALAGSAQRLSLEVRRYAKPGENKCP